MSKRGGSSSGKGNGVVVTIPAASKKMVQSLKEIVNCPENEIYAMLNECNMDPNETVNRLLSQGYIQPIFPFFGVRSLSCFLFGIHAVFVGSTAIKQTSLMLSLSSIPALFLTDP